MSVPYTIGGLSFNFSDAAAAGTADCFNRGRVQANDLGPNGAVMEIEDFIRRTENLYNLLDVGACYGLFSLVFTCRENTRAWAIEPSPWAYPQLVRQCEANPDQKIYPINLFAGEVPGREVKCARDWNHVIADEGGGDAWHKKYIGKSIQHERLMMQETRIDDMECIERVDCMKMDVEAWECRALRGAANTIEKWHPLIFLECHLATLAPHGESPEGLLSLLKGFGYRLEGHDGQSIETLSDASFKRVVCIPV